MMTNFAPVRQGAPVSGSPTPETGASSLFTKLQGRHELGHDSNTYSY